MNNYFNIKFIRENGILTLEQYGLKNKDAQIVIDSMIDADMSGVHTHGIKMLPAYINKLEKKEFEITDIEVLKSTGSFTTVDAKNSIGAISASKCVDIAIKKAKENGIHFVFSKHCNTFGPAFYYANLIGERNMIGFLCCNSPAAMPVHNGKEVMLGTNPFAFVVPSKSQGNILVDMATSIVSKSKLLLAKNQGVEIPENWALDINGIPTTDPVEAIRGLLLPMAGTKGYAIALIIDVMSGMLSGAGFLNKVNKFYSVNGLPMNVGQMFVAIDPSQIYEGDFFSDMDKYINLIRNSKCIEGTKISIPGDRKYMSKLVASEEGLELSDDTVKKLEELFGTHLMQ